MCSCRLKERGEEGGATVPHFCCTGLQEAYTIGGERREKQSSRGEMNSSEGGKDDTIDMEIRDVDIPRLTSSTSDSSGIRTRSGSDGAFDTGEIMNSSSRRDGTDNTSLDDQGEENDSGTGNSNANEAKVADVDFDYEHSSPGDDVERFIIDGDHEDGEKPGSGAGANARLSQMRQTTARRIDHTTEISAVKQASHLIRNVEIDAICLWDGDGRDEPVTDVRIVMVVCIMISPCQSENVH